MHVSDVLNSCSHTSVAEAAVASIGGEFAKSIGSHARQRGVTIGDFTAYHVRRFSGRASERDWRLVAATMHGEDLALLAGLQTVVLRMIAEDGDLPARSRAQESAQSIAA